VKHHCRREKPRTGPGDKPRKSRPPRKGQPTRRSGIPLKSGPSASSETVEHRFFEGRDRGTDSSTSSAGPLISSEIGRQRCAGERTGKSASMPSGASRLFSSETKRQRCAREGTGDRPRSPHVPVDRFLRKPFGDGARGWVRRLGLAALMCRLIGFFGGRSATVRGGGPGDLASQPSRARRLVSSEAVRQWRAKVGPGNRSQSSRTSVLQSLRRSKGNGAREWRSRNRPQRS
jgi:hypothetical protein